MAENKKSFLLYCDYIDVFNRLPDEVAGKLIKHIFDYTNDLNPQTDDLLLNVAFEPIKKQLKRDLSKYEDVRRKNSENARKRWDAKKCDRINTDAKNADTDNDTDTVNDKEIEYLTIWENFPYKTEFKKSLNLFEEKFRPTTPSQKIDWLDVFEKSVRLDKYSPEKISELIKWAREDDFWKSNLMSLNSLRKKGAGGIKKIDSINAKFSSEKDSSSQKTNNNQSKNRTEKLKEDTIKAARILGLTNDQYGN